jgi:uncharacterized membrane-anchored protein
MRFSSRAGASSRSLDGAVAGPVRSDRRTSVLLSKARPGDVAVLDHLDLDLRTAQALVDRQVAAVVNAGPFISGRYPALGAEVLASAGIVLVDNVGPRVFSELDNGDRVQVDDDRLVVKGRTVATGRRLSLDDVLELMESARAGLATQLESFTHSTTEYLRREQELLLHGQGIPDVRARIQGRPVVVVVKAFDHARDLHRIRRFVREQRPVLVAVDDGADALLALKLKPDVLVIGEAGLARVPGTADRVVSDDALRAAREVVVHADATDRATGADRLERLGVRPVRVATSGTSEDLALLLADVKGASLIVAVGTHTTLDEFLDRQRAGLASTFLTRLRVGSRLVDAKAVPALYSGRVRAWQLVLLLLAGLVAVVAALSTTPAGEDLLRAAAAAAESLYDDLRGLIS